jgi:hypothetical protein
MLLILAKQTHKLLQAMMVWEQKVESVHDKIKRYQEKADRQNASQPSRSRDKGAR